MDYGILQVLGGHTEDVRSVCSFPNSSVLTASRDKTVKLFKPHDSTSKHSEFVESQTFIGPEHFVSTVCYGRTKAGKIEIYAGSHDHNIYVFDPMLSLPIAILSKHLGPVSALAFRICDDEDVIVSGSWDEVAIIWRNKEPAVTLYGHKNAIWRVAFVARTHVLTAGADTLIRKWNVSDGTLDKVFYGHQDVVRGLAVVNALSFLSCSNDAKIIMWNMNGDRVRTFEGHENFIFDITLVREPLTPGVEPPKNRPYKFVTVSEDKTVRVWDKEAGCIQTIPLQATTLWSATALENGNFVIGTSDGHAYVFSTSLPPLPHLGSDKHPVASSSRGSK